MSTIKRAALLNQWTFSYVIEFSETPPVLTSLLRLSDGTFQFMITNRPGSYFQVYATTNLLLPFNQWTLLGSIPENPAGVFPVRGFPGNQHAGAVLSSHFTIIGGYVVEIVPEPNAVSLLAAALIIAARAGKIKVRRR